MTNTRTKDSDTYRRSKHNITKKSKKTKKTKKKHNVTKKTKKTKKTYVQSVLFDNKEFTTEDARKWLHKHNFEPIKRVHRTKQNLRYRLRNPNPKHNYITKNIKQTKIKLIIGFS